VRSGGVVRTVIGLSGTVVRLAEADATVMTVALPLLQVGADFAVVSRHERPALPAVTALEALPVTAAERARWWERHVVELLHGLPPDAPAGAAPRPEYDPARHSLASREGTVALAGREPSDPGVGVGFRWRARVR
jgi:hypothetical protein